MGNFCSCSDLVSWISPILELIKYFVRKPIAPVDLTKTLEILNEDIVQDMQKVKEQYEEEKLALQQNEAAEERLLKERLKQLTREQQNLQKAEAQLMEQRSKTNEQERLMKEKSKTIEQQNKRIEEEELAARSKQWRRQTKLGSAVTAEDLIRKARSELGMDMENQFNFAFVGESGAGKSSMINALTGVDENDPDAARVGVTETTMKMKKYVHPMHSHIVFWDIPGAGTLKQPAETYFKDQMLYAFDCILLLSTSRFTEIDFQIAINAAKFKKMCAFVWTKSDQGVDSIVRRLKITKSEASKQLKQQVIASFKENAAKLGVQVEAHKLFVVSAWALTTEGIQKIDETECMRFVMEASLAARQRPTHQNMRAPVARESASLRQSTTPGAESGAGSLALNMRKRVSEPVARASASTSCKQSDPHGQLVIKPSRGPEGGAGCVSACCCAAMCLVVVVVVVWVLFYST